MHESDQARALTNEVNGQKIQYLEKNSVLSQPGVVPKCLSKST